MNTILLGRSVQATLTFQLVCSILNLFICISCLNRLQNQRCIKILQFVCYYQKDLQLLLKQQQENHNEEIAKFDLIFKENKKLSNNQIIELNKQIKLLFDEIETLKNQLNLEHEKNKNLLLEKEKLIYENDKNNKLNNEKFDDFEKENIT